MQINNVPNNTRKCISKVLFRNLYDNEKMLEYIIKVIFENIKYAIIKSGE